MPAQGFSVCCQVRLVLSWVRCGHPMAAVWLQQVCNVSSLQCCNCAKLGSSGGVLLQAAV